MFEISEKIANVFEAPLLILRFSASTKDEDGATK
jgi:hypothetical protein